MKNSIALVGKSRTCVREVRFFYTPLITNKIQYPLDNNIK